MLVFRNRRFQCIVSPSYFDAHGKKASFSFYSCRVRPVEAVEFLESGGTGKIAAAAETAEQVVLCPSLLLPSEVQQDCHCGTLHIKAFCFCVLQLGLQAAPKAQLSSIKSENNLCFKG